jgi:hypothetical protein
MTENHHLESYRVKFNHDIQIKELQTKPDANHNTIEAMEKKPPVDK